VRRNAVISHRRATIEPLFAMLKRVCGFGRARYRGLMQQQRSISSDGHGWRPTPPDLTTHPAIMAYLRADVTSAYTRRFAQLPQKPSLELVMQQVSEVVPIAPDTLKALEFFTLRWRKTYNECRPLTPIVDEMR
jgi:hypothetical protein